MFGLFLFALIFGFGVIVIDLLGLLGSGDDDGTDVEDSGGWDEGTESADEGVEQGNLDADDDAVVLPDLKRGRWIYRSLNTLRNIVYFCLGFGAVGVFGSLTGRPLVVTLIWSAGTGIVVLILVRLIMRIQNKVVDSQLSDADMLFAEAQVLVSIPAGGLGRVRMRSGGSYHDIYARGKDAGRVYPMGETVFVVDLSGADPVVHTEKE